MSEHEQSIGLSSDWYTPPEYFQALGLSTLIRQEHMVRKMMLNIHTI
jgi:hypothetical protein